MSIVKLRQTNFVNNNFKYFIWTETWSGVVFGKRLNAEGAILNDKHTGRRFLVGSQIYLSVNPNYLIITYTLYNDSGWNSFRKAQNIIVRT